MDAEVVWRTWRRMLYEPAFAEDVFALDQFTLNERWHLTADERAVADAYASAANRSKWAVSTYRYRVVSSALHALEMGAPLTRSLLEVAGFDLRGLATQFLNEEGWHDRGPFVYTMCAAFLAKLSDSPGTTVHGLQELVSIEAAAVDLIRRAAHKSLLRFDHQPRALDIDSHVFEQTGTGEIVTTSLRISPWLTNTTQIGRSLLAEGSESYLVYVRADSEQYGLLMLEPLASEILDAFQRPMTLSAVAGSLGIDDGAVPDLKNLLTVFLEAGVLKSTKLATIA